MFFSPFSIAITSPADERVNLSVFRTFVRCVVVWFCRISLPIGVWEGLRFVIVIVALHFLNLSLAFLLPWKSDKSFSHEGLSQPNSLVCNYREK